MSISITAPSITEGPVEVMRMVLAREILRGHVWVPVAPGGRSGHLPRLALPVARAQLLLVDLAVEQARQRLEEIHAARLLVARDLAAAVGDELVLARGHVGPQNDAGLDRFAPARIRHADNRGLQHGRMGQ